MAYNTKYRIQFKDYYGVTIQADIQQDGWSVGNITEVKPTSNPLTIDWPGDRDDIYNPVRGAVATLNFFASSSGQFNEFFDANTKEYQLVVSIGGSTYWTGYLTLQDYQEALLYPPYEVSVKAYDLGYLKSISWDGQYHDDDTILDVIYRIIGNCIQIGVVEGVNIYEDSISSGASDSMLDLINIHPPSLMDDSWNGITQYEALSRLLKPFGAFIVQEYNAWNICRISDLKVSHNRRTFAYPQLYLSSASEDLRSDLSNYRQIDRSALMMACPNYRKLIMSQDYGLKNLVNNHACNTSATALDYWNIDNGGSIAYTSGTFSPFPTVYYNGGAFIRISYPGAGGRNTITHERTYKVSSGTKFEVSHLYEIRGSAASGTATSVKITVKIDDGSTPYYLNVSTGAWSTTSTVDTISFSATANRVGTLTSFTTNSTPISGTMTISLTEANWSGASGYTFFRLSIVPEFINSSWSIESGSLTETIDADSLEDLTETFYFGDPKDSDSRDIMAGALTIAADGTSTDAWGPTGLPLLNITRTNYRDQFKTAARRLQCTLKGDLDYLTVLRDSSDRCYLASSVIRDFRRSELRGEWIEIKANRLLADIVACWELDETSGTTVTDALGSNNGTNSGATVNQSGKVGTAYDFNGTSDYISFPYSDFEFNPLTESYTISIWVNSTNPSPTADVVYLINMWSGVGGDVRPFVFNIVPSSSDLVSMVMYDGSTSLSADIAGASVWDGEWHLLSMVVDHSSGEFYSYLDGVLQDTTEITFPGWTPISTPYFYISSIGSATPARFYDGLADQITVHNRALEAIELINLARGVPYDEFGI